MALSKRKIGVLYDKLNKVVRNKTKWQLANEIMDLKSQIHGVRVSTGLQISKMKQEMEV
tara:strand:+ start:1328 stop:1504 length:177 start_codon:yes stop_codon:yes gene_type:complete